MFAAHPVTLFAKYGTAWSLLGDQEIPKQDCITGGQNARWEFSAKDTGAMSMTTGIVAAGGDWLAGINGIQFWPDDSSDVKAGRGSCWSSPSSAYKC